MTLRRFLRLSFGETAGLGSRCLVGLAYAAAATLVRLACEPVLEDQAPYLPYVAGVVVATWAGGPAAGVVASVASAEAGYYFFVPPRFQLTPYHLHDVVAMGVFLVVALGLVWVVSRWRRSEDGLRHEHRRLSALINSIPDEVWCIDAAGRVVLVNDAVRTTLGVPVGPLPVDLNEVLARLEVYTPDGRVRPAQDSPMLDALRGETVTGEEMVRHPRAGDLRNRRYSAAPVRSGGAIIGAVVVAADITERKRAEEALRETATKLADANRLKDEFLATLSHELRTPLNAIVGWSEMLLHGLCDAATTRHALEVIDRNAKTQTAVISDLLDVSRITSGHVRLALQPVDLRESVRGTLDAVRPAADAKDIELVCLATPGAVVQGDPDRLQQICWNLMSNAVKFTPKGGCVQVCVRRTASDVEFRVRDTGMGIAPEFLPYVFERFRQADGSTARQYGGIGMGLALVRHLVELHGGRVTAESAGAGQGATFTVTLPVPAPAHQTPGTDAPATKGAVSRDAERTVALHVLVIDDGAETRHVLQGVRQWRDVPPELGGSEADPWRSGLRPSG